MTGPQQPTQDDTGHRETASGIGAPNVEPAGVRPFCLVCEVDGVLLIGGVCHSCDDTDELIAAKLMQKIAWLRKIEARHTVASQKNRRYRRAIRNVERALEREQLHSARAVAREKAADARAREVTNGRGIRSVRAVIGEVRFDKLIADIAASCSLPQDSIVGAAKPATDAAADVPHETPDIQP